MSKAIYFYGVMKSSKTGQLLTMNYNYNKNNVVPVIVKPKLDTRSTYVYSRLGLKAKADVIVDTTANNQVDISEKIASLANKSNSKVVLVDEAQFMTPEFIKRLSECCKALDIDLYGFGLLKDFRNKLFVGAKTWIECADSIREVKTTCELCNHKATCNTLEDSKGNLVPETFVSGSNNHIGDTEYHVYCQYHLLLKTYKQINNNKPLNIYDLDFDDYDAKTSV